jgi:hypothetical protein
MKLTETLKKLPEYLKILKVVVGLLNGKKLNTGAVMLLAVFVLQQIGVNESEANEIAQNCLLAFGSILTAWGYAHRLIKAKQGKATPKPAGE